jgi:hypothetical protein
MTDDLDDETNERLAALSELGAYLERLRDLRREAASDADPELNGLDQLIASVEWLKGDVLVGGDLEAVRILRRDLDKCLSLFAWEEEDWELPAEWDDPERARILAALAAVNRERKADKGPILRGEAFEEEKARLEEAIEDAWEAAGVEDIALGPGDPIVDSVIRERYGGWTRNAWLLLGAAFDDEDEDEEDE